jgi:uncharacterized protein YdcH (DUF465 family)
MELTEPVKQFLAGKDVEFRRLAARHKELSDKLEKFVHRSDLAEAEQQEERLIKKEKLNLKDQMLAIAAKYKDELAKIA